MQGDNLDLTINEIAKACNGTLVLKNITRIDNGISVSEEADGEQKISSLELDSRKVLPFGAFLATVGERVDGHRFVADVFVKNEACLVITEKTPEQVEAEHGIPVSAWGSYILVKDSFRALKEIAEYYRSKLNIPIVGITGSVGKTSTKEFIASVLAEQFAVLKTEGNYNNEVGVPLTLLKIRPKHTAAVIEMGISDFGEMHRLSKMVKPNVCVITNIGQCHLENLKTRDGILKAKTEIFDFMAPDGEVCLNGEDDKLRTVTQVNGKKVHFFGLGGFAQEEMYADDVKSKGLLGSDIVLRCNQDTAWEDGQMQMDAHVQMPGMHMVINAAAAACVGRVLNVTSEHIAEGIRKVTPIGGRNNLISLPHYTLIDDCYNANPVSMKSSIDLLTLADTAKVAILGDMFELGADSDTMHEEVGSYAAQKGIDYIYCVGENSKHMYEAAMRTVDRMCSGMTDVQSMSEGEMQIKIRYFETREVLLTALAQDREHMIPEGATVLLKASHGMKFTEVLEYLKLY